ncbi:flagellin [Halobacillus karajensis]|nr:flagellin [Halobacillus karajensis]
MNDNYYNLSDVENNGSDDGFVVKEGTSEYGAGAAMIDDETVTKGIDISSQASTDAFITTSDNAIQSVSAERSKLGAVQNRLDHTINNLGTSSENLTAAESRIRDVDMSEEMMKSNEVIYLVSSFSSDARESKPATTGSSSTSTLINIKELI